MTNTVGMASCPSKLVRIPVQSNVKRLSQLQCQARLKNVFVNMTNKLSSGLDGGCIGWQ